MRKGIIKPGASPRTITECGNMNAEQAKAIMDVIDLAKNDIEERTLDALEESIDDEEELIAEMDEVRTKLRKLYENMDSFWGVLRDMLTDDEKRKFDRL